MFVGWGLWVVQDLASGLPWTLQLHPPVFDSKTHQRPELRTNSTNCARARSSRALTALPSDGSGAKQCSRQFAGEHQNPLHRHSTCHVWKPDTTYVLGILLEHFILHQKVGRPSPCGCRGNGWRFSWLSDKFDPPPWLPVTLPVDPLDPQAVSSQSCDQIPLVTAVTSISSVRIPIFSRDNDWRHRYLELRRLLLAWPGGHSCNMVNLRSTKNLEDWLVHFTIDSKRLKVLKCISPRLTQIASSTTLKGFRHRGLLVTFAFTTIVSAWFSSKACFDHRLWLEESFLFIFCKTISETF